VPLETAIALLKDMGGSSIKYFPMGGLKHRDEFVAVAQACARHDFWLEPTGIDLENYSEILQIALDAGSAKLFRISTARLSIKPAATPARRTFASCWR
jgi:uncharacterized protein (TIGR03581 family)